jgi:hypothetical protein
MKLIRFNKTQLSFMLFFCNDWNENKYHDYKHKNNTKHIVSPYQSIEICRLATLYSLSSEQKSWQQFVSPISDAKTPVLLGKSSPFQNGTC